MPIAETVPSILRSLEAAAFDQREWQRALNLMAEAFRSTVFAIREFEAPRFSYLASEAGDEITRNYLAGGWDQTDLRAHRFMRAPERRLITDADLVSAEEMQGSEFYRGFANVHGLTHLTAWRVDLGDSSLAFASNRSESVGRLTAEERAALKQLVTPASTAALISSQVSKARDSAFQEALSASDAAAIILGKRCSMLAATPAAERLFGPGFGTQDGRLVANSCSPADALPSLYAAISSPELEPRRLNPFTTNTTQGKVLCLPLILRGSGCDVFSGARALLIIRSLELTRAPDRDHLVRLFGMTTSQADVASLLAQGRNAAEIATIRHVSIDTVRAMLKAAFAKTGARSQAELVALVLRATTGIAH